MAVTGEADLATAGQLHAALTAELHRCRGLVLDLTALGFLGVAGARVLDAVVNEATGAGLPVAVVGLTALGRCTAAAVGPAVPRVHHRTVPEALREVAPLPSTPGARG